MGEQLTSEKTAPATFKCSKCGKPSESAIMCDKCWERYEPRQKSRGQWYEHPTKRGQRKAERLEEKRSHAWARVFRAIEAMAEAENEELTPGWTERLQDEINMFLINERRRGERLEWLSATWRRQIDIQIWRDHLAEIKAIRKWSTLKRAGGGVYDTETGEFYDTTTKDGVWIARDNIVTSNLRWDNRIFDSTHPETNERVLMEAAVVEVEEENEPLFDFNYRMVTALPWWHPDRKQMRPLTVAQVAYLEQTGMRETQKEIDELSIERFFNATADLSDDDFATLQVYVHQQIAQRDNESQRACTSKDAAQILSLKLGKRVTAAAYRKKVERMKEALGRDIDLFIKYRYL